MFAQDSDGASPATTLNNPFPTSTSGLYEWYEADAVRRYITIVTPGGLLQDVTRTVDVMKVPATSITIRDEGVAVTQRPNLNFIGSAVSVTDDAANNETEITITAASGAAFAGTRVYKSAPQSIANATTTVVSFDTESYDTNGWHDNATNNSRITPLTAGYVRPSGTVDFLSNATGYRLVEVRKNGLVIQRATVAAASGEATVVAFAFDPISMNGTTDYLEVAVKQNSGGALNVSAGAAYVTCFAVEYLGA